MISFFHELPSTGYIIYYSTDVNAEIHDWVIEPVVGNRLTHQIQELTLDTPYYFKIQARNSKGMGPMSEAVQFRTPKGKLPWNRVLFYLFSRAMLAYVTWAVRTEGKSKSPDGESQDLPVSRSTFKWPSATHRPPSQDPLVVGLNISYIQTREVWF